MEPIATALKTLGHTDRLRILALLRQGELTVSELVQILDLSQPRVTQYIKSLENVDGPFDMDFEPTNIAIEHEYVHVFCLERDGVAPIWSSPWSDLKDCLLAKEQELLAANLSDDELSSQYTEWFRLHKPQLGPLQEYNQIDRGGIFTASRSVHNPGREGYRWDLMNPKTQKLVP